MAYATHGDIDARYPGELAQAGPRDASGDFDYAAVDLALADADATIDRYLRARGWTVPLVGNAPDWVKGLAVDLALYLATPTALASQDDFSDRRDRYKAALATLDAIAKGELLPPAPGGSTTAETLIFATGNARMFGRGTL